MLSPPRPSAVFLTHLLAVAEGVPDARARRRASDTDAHLAYRAGDTRTSAYRTAPASGLSRTV